MISAFKHIRLSGYNLTPVQDGNTLRLGLGNSGLAYYNELTGISGYLQTLITAASADINHLNITGSLVSGNAILTGLNGTQINFNAATNTIEINGNSGYFQSLSDQINLDLASTGSNLYTLLTNFSGGLSTNFASQQALYTLSGNLEATGSVLDGKINSLSGNLTANYATISNLGLTGSTLDTKVNTLSGYVNSQDVILSNQIASTGSVLDNKINSLSGYSASAANLASTGSSLYSMLTGFSGNLDANFASDLQLFTTGSTLDNKINSLSGFSASAVNLAATGSTLDTKINSLSGSVDTQIFNTGSVLNTKINTLSGYANASFVTKTSNQVFTTALNNPVGLDAYGINYPVPFAFGTTPKIQATLEVAGDVMYNLSIRSIGLTGFTGIFSDNIIEAGALLHTFASTQ